MASSPTEHRFTAPDGIELAWYELGQGRPVLLLHGLFSNAKTNWIRYGHAEAIADRGFRVIMSDLRAHGSSGAPRDPGHYPPDVLADDAEALVAALGLTDYDLGGYSLGARTAVRMITRGARPRRAVFAGMGLQGLLATGERAEHFRHILTHLGSFEKFTPEWNAEAFLKTTRADPEALLHILDTFVDTARGELATIAMPTLVVAGDEDQDNGSAAELAAALPNARYVEVPGGHMSSVTRPELGEAIATFLGE